MMNDKRTRAILSAVTAALCYGTSAPLSKLLLAHLPATFMAALLYLGAGLGMAVLALVRKFSGAKTKDASLTAKELPYVLAMIALDIAAPVLFMLGLSLTSPSGVALLNNFEIVATTLVARIVFREAVGKRMWLAILLITLASVLLTVEDISSLSFSAGSVFVVLACLCWGIENNCTRMLSIRDPMQIVLIKGIGSGLGALGIAYFTNALRMEALYIGLALLLGCFSYGMSIYFYVLAQRELGAARTSAYYAIAPFIGVALSLALFRQPVSVAFLAALLVMAAGVYFTVFEKHSHRHTHEAVTHEHRHTHHDGHHLHSHESPAGEHSHVHTHEALTHMHAHAPDLHHTHTHEKSYD